MSCNNCHQHNTPCTCKSSICNDCPPETPCDCPIKNFDLKCTTFKGASIVEPNILTNDDGETVIRKLVNYIKSATLVQAAVNLFSIGLGAKVYKGIDSLGRREIRSITNSDNLIVVAENPNDISVGVDEANLTTFINNMSGGGLNVGIGAGEVFRDKTSGTFNFRKIKTENTGVGASVLSTESVFGDNVIISARKIKTDNSGELGESILKTESQGISGISILARKLASKGSLIIETSIDDNTIYIDTSPITDILGLIVNNSYSPTYNEWLTENKARNGGTAISGFLFRGLGTMLQPYTDTRLYTLGSPLVLPTITPNSSISNAILAFLGGNARTSPALTGQKIRVQKSIIPYIYAGDFSYSNLYLVLDADVSCITTDWLIDMDNPIYFDPLNATCTIEISENAVLSIPNSLGFRNSGNTDSISPAFSTGRIGYLIGDGEIYSNYNGANVLTQYIINGNGNVNNGGLQFQIKCKLRADYQGIYFTQNTQRIDFYNQLTSGIFLGSVNLALQAFRMTGGQVRFYEKGAVKILAQTSGRIYGFTFEPPVGGSAAFQLNSAKVVANLQYCFAKLNDELVQFTAFNSPSGESFTTIPNGLFENLGVLRWNINFKNNVFSTTGIDQTKVDLTQGNNVSTSNFIGNNIVESLVTRPARIGSGLPIGSAFINTGGSINTATWTRDIMI
jgi:hypothetical protein